MTNQNTNNQIELPLNNRNSNRTHRQRTRIERAAWWFRRMHQAVDQAATPNRNLQPAQV